MMQPLEPPNTEAAAWTPPPQQGEPPPPRWAKIAAACIVGAVVLAIAIGMATHKDKPKTIVGANLNDTSTFTHEIVYQLSGTATSADLTMSTNTGQSQQQGVKVPMTSSRDGTPGLHFTVDTGTFLYFSAQNTGGGDLTCSITEDGVEISNNTASGDYAIATCDGSA